MTDRKYPKSFGAKVIAMVGDASGDANLVTGVAGPTRNADKMRHEEPVFIDNIEDFHGAIRPIASRCFAPFAAGTLERADALNNPTATLDADWPVS